MLVHSKVKELPWRGEPLPRGRHKLARRSVRSSQRERLLRGIIECVAHHGFEATTVPMVVASARVSSNAFYEHFADKTDCFLRACDELAGDLLSELVTLVSEPDWIQALSKGMTVYLQWWRERPAFARAYLLSLQHAGERAAEQRERTYSLFEAMFADLAHRARAEQPELPPQSPLVPRALVVAITDAVTERVRNGDEAAPTELERGLTTLAIRLLADDATAARWGR
jgi:AcrR family transcriptional regulator